MNSDQKDAAQREVETLAVALHEANSEARLTGDYSKLAPIAEELEDCAATPPFIKKEGDLNLERIRLAVLKLSGGHLSDLKRFISTAKVDWRDVLALAEAPEQFSVGFVEFEQLDLTTRETIQNRDHEQYQRWLES